MVFNMPRGFGIVPDLAAVHTNTVGSTTQSITVFNYLFGPRYRFRPVFKRYVPYAQILGGGSQELSSYTAVQNVKGGPSAPEAASAPPSAPTSVGPSSEQTGSIPGYPTRRTICRTTCASAVQSALALGLADTSRESGLNSFRRL